MRDSDQHAEYVRVLECAQGHQFNAKMLGSGPCPYCLGQLWRIDKSEPDD